MACWTFRCYVDEDGKDVIDKWRETQEDKFQARIDTRLKYLQQQPREGWTRPDFDTLGGGFKGLGELRLKYKNVQHRLIGFASGEMEYTWLLAMTKKGKKFEPKNASEIAQRRRLEVMADRRRARVCEFD